MIVGTAGHIDHGKSALVEALTGRRMDPFADEQRRGMTLDLHVAPLTVPGSEPLGIVDVPGHADLVRTMAAGAAGMDLVLLVIASDEGIMPQTREHLAIAEQFAVPFGIPVLSKSDLVEAEWLELVRADVRQALAGSPIAWSEPITVSARSGAGLDQLRARLRAHPARNPRRMDVDLARMPVDRVLSVAGTGTVVTGTTWSGRFRVGDQVRLLPGGHSSRIRTLEEFGQPVQASSAGRRLAVGLVGIERAVVRRGDLLVAAEDPWQVSRAIDVALALLPSSAAALIHQARVRVHHGAAETLARVHVRAPIAPGGQGIARLVLEEPIVARGGDRLVLRRYSPVELIGGGSVLDPAPPAGRSQWPAGLASADPGIRLAALVARRATGIAETALPVLLGLAPADALTLSSPDFRRADGLLVGEAQVAEARAAAAALIGAHHEAHPSQPGLSAETVRQGLRRFGAAGPIALGDAERAGTLVTDGALLRSAGFHPRPGAGEAALDDVIRAVEAAGLTPPAVAELGQLLGRAGVADAVRLAARAGRLEAVEPDRYYGIGALERFATILRELGHGGAITPARARDATGLSRKFLIPLLEWADRRGITRREGDTRVLVRPR